MATLNAINPYLKYGARLLYNVGVAGRRRVRDGCLHAVLRVDRRARVLRNQHLVAVLRRRDEDALVGVVGVAHVDKLSIVRRRHRAHNDESEILKRIHVRLHVGNIRMGTDVHTSRIVVCRIVVGRRAVRSGTRIPARRLVRIRCRVGIRRVKGRRCAGDLHRFRQRRRAVYRRHIDLRAVRTDYANRDPCGNVRHGRRAFAELLASLFNRHQPRSNPRKPNRRRYGRK